MLIKLLVICTYENSNLLEKEIISLSEKYDLILPSWFENNSYYDKKYNIFFIEKCIFYFVKLYN